MGCCWR